jgi:hypothetical protein
MKIELLLLTALIFSIVSLSAAEDVKIEGTAIKDFQRIGAWGWEVNVDKVLNGPNDMQGKKISIYLTSANPAEYPPGFLDPKIAKDDKVEAFGILETIEPEEYSILLVGSTEYYLRSV